MVYLNSMLKIIEPATQHLITFTKLLNVLEIRIYDFGELDFLNPKNV